jgi:hypothetical protein
MSLREGLEVMARYNQWMNINLFDVAAGAKRRPRRILCFDFGNTQPHSCGRCGLAKTFYRTW